MAAFLIVVLCPSAESGKRLFFAPPTVEVPDHATPAPAGFTGTTNGLVDQAIHDQDRQVFAENEEIEEGLGPVYNGTSCAEYHASPIAGVASQIAELRVAAPDYNRFREKGRGRNRENEVLLSRSLVSDRIICPDSDCPEITALIRAPEGTIPAERMSLNLLGDGFVETMDDALLRSIADQRCSKKDGTCGEVIEIPILELDGAAGIGRFGWRNQHASLKSFAADAYLNEMGIASPFLPDEVTDVCDLVEDPEDEGADVESFARFMRAPEAQGGQIVFEQIGCANCHVPMPVIAPAGTVLSGGACTVPEALGSKTFSPCGDFLLHNVGTGDVVVQNGPKSTQNKLRTAPPWGSAVQDAPAARQAFHNLQRCHPEAPRRGCTGVDTTQATFATGPRKSDHLFELALSFRPL